jgi:hypothetical protein
LRVGSWAVRWIFARDVHWDDSKAAKWVEWRVALKAVSMALTKAENWASRSAVLSGIQMAASLAQQKVGYSVVHWASQWVACLVMQLVDAMVMQRVVSRVEKTAKWKAAHSVVRWVARKDE